MGDRNEPTYEEVKRESWNTSDGSIQKMTESTKDDLAPSLIYRQLRDLKAAVDDGDILISDLFDKFDAVLATDMSPSESEQKDPGPVRVNSDLYSAIGQLEQHVLKQHARLRTLMERCEL